MTDPTATARSDSVDDSDESDEDASAAQAQIIASLRGQVTDLFSQVTQLNSKLVASYDRVSDLEDQLHDTSGSLRNATVTISSLELERSHHLAALNTGLLVEKAHVTAELNRLMERATEEAAQRGQAESARQDIEKDLDDLSASLFDQANTMVAEARLSQAKSERKVQEAQDALKIAEDAVKDMQVQMQALQAEKEAAEHDARSAKHTMGKGKWVEREDLRVGEVRKIHFMTTHLPYGEFIAFITHLRGMRASQPTPPAISTLLSQPFITRLINEDSEPTVRLDLAPSLNWLSRRSVLAAIHTGMLTVEPIPFPSLVQELHQHPQSMSTSTLSCALCGMLVARLPSTSPVSRTNNTNGSSWFKYPLALGSTQSHHSGTQATECEPPGQVYIFRLTATTTSTPPPMLAPTHISSVSMPSIGPSFKPPLNAISPSRVIQSQTQSTPYPLCTSNYCLTRLRSTCSLWAFVRFGIVERIWEEEAAQSPKPLVNGNSTEEIPSSLPSASTGNQPVSNTNVSVTSEKPPVPPRRRRLWEMASALGERAVSWGKESGENIKEKEKDSTKKLPPPPPSHPSAPHPHAESPTSQVDAQAPPPLPKRNVVHETAPTDIDVPTSGAQNEMAGVTTEPPSSADGHTDPEKADLDASETFSTPTDDITFTSPPSEPSPPPFTTSHPISAEPSAPLIQDQLPPPSPHTVPLPLTPTAPTLIARATSPAPRPRSRLSSPASPPMSRPASPAVSRSRAGSPAPAETAPSSRHVSHIRGKASTSSPLAPSSRSASPIPATGPYAPPLPRRAPARRAPPPPPPPTTSGAPKAAEEGVKEEVVASVVDTTTATAAATVETETGESKATEMEVAAETKGSVTEGDGGVNVVKEEIVPQATSVPAPTLEASEFAKGSTIDDTNVARGDVQGDVNVTSVSDPHPPPTLEGDGHASVDTASTKQSSSTEGEGFASDATWEERTWKELARLKEDMFLARLGGIHG